jgi:hypothetical protein
VIKYRLRCASAHEFEAWFASGACYEAQADNRQICCPECASRDVGKAIMAPHVAARARPEGATATPAGEDDLVDKLRQFRRWMLASAEDVGRRFPEEARKIHYGETAPRGIHGQASGEEARELLDEGIEIVALPPLPEDVN